MVRKDKTIREMAAGQVAYFIVELSHSRHEFYSVVFDQMHKKQWSYARPAVFQYRLEERHLDMTFQELINQYQWLKTRGKLPPSNMADAENGDRKNRISYQG